MKSENVKHFLPLDVLRGLFQDIVATYPSERKNCDRDLKRILRNFEHRGYHSLILELSSVDNTLLTILSTGKLPSSFSHDYFCHVKSGKPVFLQGLWKLVLDNEGNLRDDADPTAIFFIRSVCSLFKKSDIEPHVEKRKEKIDEFRCIERDLIPFGNDWDIDSDRYNGDTIGICNYAGTFFQNLDSINNGNEDLLETCQYVADYFAGLVENEYCSRSRLGTLGRSSKHGTGAVAEGTRRIDKYGVSSANLSLIEFCERIAGDTEYASLAMDHVKAKTIPSKLMAVPKDGRGPRLIAAEPTWNMWFQQALLDFFSKSVFKRTPLKSVVDLKDQHKSQIMAKKGSKDQSLATIDLQSASDRLSCDLVHKIFRNAPSFRFALFAARTQQCEVEGEIIQLSKFATQGSATTFPLQCYVFSILAISSCLHETFGHMRGKTIKPYIDYIISMGYVRVFGDDIIVPTRASGVVKRLLGLCGLKVNSDKSFDTGYFRESCGGDYYKGYDVTPAKMRLAYVKDKAIDVQALVDFSNNLYRKGLWNASSACLRHAFRIDPRAASQPFIKVGL